MGGGIFNVCVLAVLQLVDSTLSSFADIPESRKRFKIGSQEFLAFDTFHPTPDFHHETGQLKSIVFPSSLNEYIWPTNGGLHERTHENSKLDRIVLEPVTQNLVSPNIPVIVRGRHSNRLQVGATDPQCHFQHRSNHISASLSTCHERGLEGFIHLADDTFFIQPLARNNHSNSDIIHREHIIYKRDTSNIQRHKRATNSRYLNPISSQQVSSFYNSIRWDARSARSSKPFNDELTVELGVFVDEKLWTKYLDIYNNDHSEALAQLKSFITTVFNNIQIIFHHPSLEQEVKFRIVRLEVFEQQPFNIRDSAHRSGSAQEYLDLFCRYQNRLKKEWDHAFLFTGYDLHRVSTTAISGIGKLKGMCSSWGSCTIGEGLDFASVFIGAHEIGHNLGMLHDEAYGCGSDHIMSGTLGTGKVKWSTCSANAVREFIDKLDRQRYNCLRTNLYEETLAVNLNNVLPGDRFNGDRQCQMMYGSDYVKINRGRDLCKMMWCEKVRSGRVITSHPALEGTRCGVDKWCRGGDCVSMDKTKRHPESRAKVSTALSPLLPGLFPHPRLPQQKSVTPLQANLSTSMNCDRCQTCPPFKEGISIIPTTCPECRDSQVVGYICPGPRDFTQSCPSVGGFQTFLDAVCAGFKQTKDSTLSGLGIQLVENPKRACRTFCVVEPRSSHRVKYRNFGDFLPDGSPCGVDSYCVNGICKKVGCDQKLLISTNASCPANPKSCLQTSSSPIILSTATSERRGQRVDGEWSSWSGWSACSSSCGAGHKIRRRACYDSNPCPGDETEYSDCQAAPCPITDSKWNTWSVWSECSSSCASGFQVRYRYCSGARCVSSSEKDSRSCMHETVDACPWTSWSSCSSNCFKKRYRECPAGKTSSCPDSYSSEKAVCSSSECAASALSRDSFSITIDKSRDSRSNDFGTWSYWTTCSKSCGPSGVRYRARPCLRGACPWEGYRQQEPCNTQVSCNSDGSRGDWRNWSSWSQCDKTCGLGEQVRRRDCSWSQCFGSSNEVQPCAIRACPNWSEWSDWSPCGERCDGSSQQRTRYCTNTSGGCPGDSAERRVCPRVNCVFAIASPTAFDPQWGEWGAWSYCSVTCGTGTKRRQRACYDPRCSSPVVKQETFCNAGYNCIS